MCREDLRKTNIADRLTDEDLFIVLCDDNARIWLQITTLNGAKNVFVGRQLHPLTVDQ